MNTIKNINCEWESFINSDFKGKLKNYCDKAAYK